jgi:Ca-activated chloride channel family protein
MKISLTLLFLFLMTGHRIFAQSETQVKGKLSHKDSSDLSILQILPDEFPNINVVFKAETRKGEAHWNLKKEDMIVMENAKAAKVISLQPISQKRPIFVSMVVDHSLSMAEDYTQLYDIDGQPLYTINYQTNEIDYPSGYVRPIVAAKSAGKNFINSFNFDKDKISLIGFSSKVDPIVAFSSNKNELNEKLDKMRPDGTTALYDAMIAGLEQLKGLDGMPVLVAMTDGMDNSSKNSWRKVIELGEKYDIPVYIIGLGSVEESILREIAKQTKGQFFLAKNSNSLNDIYTQISKKVQAFYELVYYSPNWASGDTTRIIELSFEADGIHLFTIPDTFNLPKEVIAYIQKKEKERTYMLYGGIAATATVIGAVTLFFIFRRRKREEEPEDIFSISNIFPNPSSGILNLEIKWPETLNELQISIVGLNGSAIKTIVLSKSDDQLDLSELIDGQYALSATDGKNIETLPFIIKK